MRNTLKKWIFSLLLVVLVITLGEDEKNVVYADSYNSSCFTDAKAFYDKIISVYDENLVYNDNDGYFYFGYRAKQATNNIGYNEIGHIFTVTLSNGKSYTVSAVIGQSETEVGSQINDGTYAYRLFKISFNKILELLEKRNPSESVNFSELYDSNKKITVEVDTIMVKWDKSTGVRKDLGSAKENGAGWFTTSGSTVSWDINTWYNNYPYENKFYWNEKGFFDLIVPVVTKGNSLTSTASISGTTAFQKMTGDVTQGNYSNMIYRVVKPNTPFSLTVTGKLAYALDDFYPNSSFMGVTNSGGTLVQMGQLGTTAGGTYLRWNYGANYSNYVKLNSYSGSRSADLKTLTSTYNVQTSVHAQQLRLYYCSAVFKGGCIKNSNWVDLGNMSIISTGNKTQWSGYLKNYYTVLTDGVAPSINITSGNAEYKESTETVSVGSSGGTIDITFEEDLTIIKYYVIRNAKNGTVLTYYNAPTGPYGYYTDWTGYGDVLKSASVNVSAGNTYMIEARDIVDNVSTKTISVVLDDEPPVVTPDYDLSKWYNTKIDVTYIHDDKSGIGKGVGILFKTKSQISTNNLGTNGNIVITSDTTATTNFNLAIRNKMIDGYNTAVIHSYDKFDNSAIYTFTLKIDTIKPIITNTKDYVYMINKNFKFNAYDTVSGMQKLKLINLDTSAELKVVEQYIECKYQTIDDLFSINYTFAEAGNYRLIAYDFAGNESVYDFKVYGDSKVKIIDVNIYDYESEDDAMGIRYNYLPTGWCTEELYKYSLEDGYWNNWIDDYKSIYERYEYVCSTYITVSANEEDNVIYRFFVPTITVEAEYISPNPRIMKYEMGILNISHYGYVKELYIVLPKEYQNVSWLCEDGTIISFPMDFNVPDELSLSDVQMNTTLPLATQTVALEGDDSINLFIPTDKFENNTLKMTIIAYRGQPCDTYTNATAITQANCDIMVETVNITSIMVSSTDLSKLRWCIGSYGGWKLLD